MIDCWAFNVCRYIFSNIFLREESIGAIIISSIIAVVAIAVTLVLIFTLSGKKTYKINFYNDEAKTSLICSKEVAEGDTVSFDYSKYTVTIPNK